jgi:26S proteasome regulatory subunit T4
MSAPPQPADPREAAIAQYRRKFLEHRELETSLKKSQRTTEAERSRAEQARVYGAKRCAACACYYCPPERADLKQLNKDYDKTEDDLKAVQNAGQIIAEVLKQLDDERCKILRQRQRGSCPWSRPRCC